mmetsp:Transcript_24641/g.58485  ORF Transcript_24641/g.58485 Transcript_24641/m.58485 type:complete len:1014 (-) Transcript_24641:68-3109(-)
MMMMMLSSTGPCFPTTVALPQHRSKNDKGDCEGEEARSTSAICVDRSTTSPTAFTTTFTRIRGRRTQSRRPCRCPTLSCQHQRSAMALMIPATMSTQAQTRKEQQPRRRRQRRCSRTRTKPVSVERELFHTKLVVRLFSTFLSFSSLLFIIVLTVVLGTSKEDLTNIAATTTTPPSSSSSTTTSSSLFVHGYTLVSPPLRRIRSSSISSCRTVSSFFYDQSRPLPLSLSSISTSSPALSRSSLSLSSSLDSGTHASTAYTKSQHTMKRRRQGSDSSSLRSRRSTTFATSRSSTSSSSSSMDHISDSPSSESSSSSSSSPAKQLFRKFQRLPLQRSYRNFWIVPAILVVLLPAWVGRLSLQSINYLFQTIAWKSIARVTLGVWAVVSIFDNVFVTKRRQRNDMTSEWTRYALKPGARGRAIMWLLLQQAFYILWASFYRTRRRSNRTGGSSGGLFGRILPGTWSRRRRRQQSIGADGKDNTSTTTTTSSSNSIEVDYSSGTASPTSRQLKYEAIRKKAGRNFSNGLLKLGPLYIKLGQIVSCRPGLLGKEWIDAMADLQDRVPARTGQDALDLAYSSLAGGKEEFDRLFVDFESTPLAAASLGQVHRAKLRSNGDEIVIKVQRPHLRQIYNQDFVLLTTIAQWMDKLPSTSRNVGGIESSWTKIFVDAEDILYREIDYRDEADNAIRFANDFGLGIGGNATTPTAKAMNNRTLPSAAEWIRTPYVYDDLSNERLLVMEFVPSIKVTNGAKLDAANVTEEDRIDLADSLARAYLRQFCAHLFFSTDPHPGNLGVEIVPETGKPRLVMYDFGQAASLTRGQGDGIEEIIEAIVDTDVDRSIEAFQKMGVLVDGADLDQVRAKVAENYRTGKVKANQKKLRRKGYVFRDDKKKEKTPSSSLSASSGNNNTDTSAAKTESAATDANDAQVMSYFSLPAEYAFVARAISQMDGVGKSLDPEFDFISSAAPYLVEIKGADKYLADEVMKFVKNLSKFQMKTIPEWWENESRKAEWGLPPG